MSDTQKAQVIREISSINEIDQLDWQSPLTDIHWYAILELCQLENGQLEQGQSENAQGESGLVQLYQQGSGQAKWEFMFAPELDQALKQAGPILVALTEQADKDWLTQLFCQVPAGLILATEADFDSTLKWAQQRLQILSPNNAKSVCRFYDPRNLAFILGGQTPAQQQGFWHQVTQLNWFDAGQWWQAALTPSDMALTEQYKMSQNELDSVTAYKGRIMTLKLQQHYQGVRPKDDISVNDLINQAIPVAKQFGAITVGDYDAWVRLALIHGDRFYLSSQFNDALSNKHSPFKKKILLIDKELSHV